MKRILKSKYFWAIVLILGAVVWWSFGRRQAPEYITEKVGRSDIVEMVDITGNLLAGVEINLDFETTGRIKTIPIKVGAAVGSGDVLATLENGDLSQRLSQAQAALDQAKAEAGLNDDAVDQARLEESNAKKYRDDLENFEDQKVSATDNSYEDSVRAYEASLSYYEKVKDDNGEGSALAKSAYVALMNAKSAKNSAEEAKTTARRSREVTLRSARNSYESLKEKTESLESKNRTMASNAAIESARAGYQLAMNAMEKARIVAPVNGTVTKVNYRVGEVLGSARTGSFGRMVSKDFIIEAQVPESDVVKLSLGQKAFATFDSLDPDEKFEADIVEIEPDATVIQDVVYYVVKLRLKDLDSRLKTGMSTDVSVEVARKTSTLFVPRRAVRDAEGKSQVEVLADSGTPEKRTVETGIEDGEGNIEILSGVKEGDVLIVEMKSK